MSDTIELEVPEGVKSDGGSIYWNKNELLRADGVRFRLTDEHKAELRACKADPVHFLENHTRIQHPDYDELIPFKLYEPQKDLVALYNSKDPDKRFIISKVGRQLGKCVVAETEVTVKNKKTGKQRNISIGGLHRILKSEVGDGVGLYKEEGKFVESFMVNDWQVKTPTGYVDILLSNKTKKYDVYKITFANGLSVKCSDKHIFITDDGNQIFAEDSLGVKIKARKGSLEVIAVVKTIDTEHMYDLTVNSASNTYFTNGVLSHNTQLTAGFFVWFVIFNDAKKVGIGAHQLAGATEVLQRVKDMYMTVPIWMQQGITKWDVQTIRLENRCEILTSATTGSGFRGKSLAILYIDEMAFIPNNVCNKFMTGTIPVISAGKKTRIFITSTPQGYNTFYEYWTGAENIDNPDRKGWNGYVPFSYDYTKVPDRDEVWLEGMRQQLTEVQFNQEVLCTFLGSSRTLISGQMLEQIKNETANSEPIDEKTVDEGFLDHIATNDDMSRYKWWEKPQNGNAYMACVDTAEGIGQDYSAITVFNITNLPYRIAFTFRGNKIAPMNFASVIETICVEYNTAFLLLEENSSKEIPYILREQLQYPNLVHTKMDKFGARITFDQGRKAKTGITMNKKVKNTGCLRLKQLIESRRLIIEDRDIFYELASFIQKENGAFEADENAHDDLVDTMVLFSWATTQELFKHLSSAVSAYDVRRLTEQYRKQKSIQEPWKESEADDYEDTHSKSEDAKLWECMDRINDDLSDGEGNGFTPLYDDMKDFYGYGDQ